MKRSRPKNSDIFNSHCDRFSRSQWPFISATVAVTVTDTIQSKIIIGAVRGAHSQLWGKSIPVCSPYAPRKYDERLGTPAIV